MLICVLYFALPIHSRYSTRSTRVKLWVFLAVISLCSSPLGLRKSWATRVSHLGNMGARPRKEDLLRSEIHSCY